MPRFLSTTTYGSRRLPALALTLCVAVLLFQQGARALPLPSDALRFFNNYFVTGGYVVAGVGLWNTGSGSINMATPVAPMTPAPEGADVLAAYLYWQVVTSLNPDVVDLHATSTFNGSPLTSPLNSDLPPTTVGLGGTNACLLNGGAGNKVYTFRADVQRFLDVDVQTGKRVINKAGGYPLTLPSTGNARTLGASLVMIYRDANPATPLNAIVLYDGTFVKQQPMTLSQRIEGFYDPANTSGRITYVAGSAQSNLGEVLRVDTDGNPATVPAGTGNLFRANSGAAWDNVTRTTAPLTGLARTQGFLDTSIAPQVTGSLGFLFNDCVAMGAMIYQTQVNDVDSDGLLDRWESSAVPILDPKGVALPHFKNMGADAAIPDVFIEVAAMRAPAGTVYGSVDAPLRESLPFVEDAFGHNHMPTPAVLQMLGEEFAAHNIRLHFDVGHPDTYHALVPPNLPVGEPSPYASQVARDYIIGDGGLSGVDASLARGGELIEETACDPTATVDCQFPEFPGTVSWKRGFYLYKKQVFDANRKDSFRFGLYAHSKGTAKSLLPCLGVLGPAGLDEMGNCSSGVPNPLIHVPAGVSGVAEFPGGGDFMITLGLWDNTSFVGTDFGIAATTMHEIGHTFGLGHGGDALPNCKPNYLSVMNYMFQLGGLVDADGTPHLGYSESVLGPINETGLIDGAYSVPGLFRTSWYAPWSDGDSGTPAKKFCNGLQFPSGTPSMVRVDGSVGELIDWNADPSVASIAQDINFDGEPDSEPGGPTTTLTGFDDWSAIRLNQVGSRRNFGGYSIGPLGVQFLSDGSELLADGSRITADGSWLLADGAEFLADGTVFLADGAEFLADGSVFLADGAEFLADGSRILADGSVFLADGAEFLADGAVLLADGHMLLADGSVFLADGAEFLADGAVFLGDGVTLLADGAVFLGDGSPLLADGSVIAWAWDLNEPTPKSAAETGNIPGPHSLTASLTSDPLPALNNRVALDWKAPLGDIASYRVHRVEGQDQSVPLDSEPIFTVPGTVTAATDFDELPNGWFTYVVDGVLPDEDETVTPRSNEYSILVTNVRPTANPMAVTVWEDYPSNTNPGNPDPIITLTGSDPDSSGTAFSVSTGPGQGTLTGVVPTLSYTSATNYNGPDSFAFTLAETSTWDNRNQVSDPATVSITVLPVNDKPSFTHAGNQTVTQPAGAQSVAGWATFDAGPADEDATQTASYEIVSNSNSSLFSVPPAISATGTLSYTPASGAHGVATIGVRVHDSGGVAEGHGAVDTGDLVTFTITVLDPATQITFTRADLWFSTSSANRTFDLKVEALRGNTIVATAFLINTTLGSGTTFDKAIKKELVAGFPDTEPFLPGETLRFKVYVQVNANSPGGDSASAETRFWYNAPAVATHLATLRPSPTEVNYYVAQGPGLQNTVPSGPPLHIVASVKKGQGYLLVGTWSITNP